MSKQYGERDAQELDAAGGHYSRHVRAMTAECLDSKSDIAAELAHRDHLICKMTDAIYSLQSVIDDNNRLVRELDELLNGEAGAAKQASLCDIVVQLRHYPDPGKMVPDGWISTTDRLPDVTGGDELHCFVCHHNNSTGKDSVFDCYYVNKPIPDDDDDWESIEDNNGRPIAIVGWYFKGAHPDYSYYYEPVCDGVTDWQPVIYPAAPKLGGE